MARPAQGFDRWGRRLFLWVSLGCTLLSAACGARGFSIEDAVPDRSIVTGSVRPAPSGSVSDEVTIRNAVSSAIVDEVGEDGIGWANVSTGSRGAIRTLRETRETGRLCRSFSATRESFEGVHLYRGETCLDSGGQWAMHRFQKVE